jgi:hypothetical protein
LKLITNTLNQISRFARLLRKREPLKPNRLLKALKQTLKVQNSTCTTPAACKLGLIHGARVHFRYALKICPGIVEAHCDICNAAARFGHRHEAESCIKKPLNSIQGISEASQDMEICLKKKGSMQKLKRFTDRQNVSDRMHGNKLMSPALLIISTFGSKV